MANLHFSIVMTAKLLLVIANRDRSPPNEKLSESYYQALEKAGYSLLSISRIFCGSEKVEYPLYSLGLATNFAESRVLSTIIDFASQLPTSAKMIFLPASNSYYIISDCYTLSFKLSCSLRPILGQMGYTSPIISRRLSLGSASVIRRIFMKSSAPIRDVDKAIRRLKPIAFLVCLKEEASAKSCNLGIEVSTEGSSVLLSFLADNPKINPARISIFGSTVVLRSDQCTVPISSVTELASLIRKIKSKAFESTFKSLFNRLSYIISVSFASFISISYQPFKISVSCGGEESISLLMDESTGEIITSPSVALPNINNIFSFSDDSICLYLLSLFTYSATQFEILQPFVPSILWEIGDSGQRLHRVLCRLCCPDVVSSESFVFSRSGISCDSMPLCQAFESLVDCAPKIGFNGLTFNSGNCIYELTANSASAWSTKIVSSRPGMPMQKLSQSFNTLQLRFPSLLRLSLSNLKTFSEMKFVSKYIREVNNAEALSFLIPFSDPINTKISVTIEDGNRAPILSARFSLCLPISWIYSVATPFDENDEIFKSFISYSALPFLAFSALFIRDLSGDWSASLGEQMSFFLIYKRKHTLNIILSHSQQFSIIIPPFGSSAMLSIALSPLVSERSTFQYSHILIFIHFSRLSEMKQLIESFFAREEFLENLSPSEHLACVSYSEFSWKKPKSTVVIQVRNGGSGFMAGVQGEGGQSKYLHSFFGGIGQSDSEFFAILPAILSIHGCENEVSSFCFSILDQFMSTAELEVDWANSMKQCSIINSKLVKIGIVCKNMKLDCTIGNENGLNFFKAYDKSGRQIISASTIEELTTSISELLL